MQNTESMEKKTHEDCSEQEKINVDSEFIAHTSAIA